MPQQLPLARVEGLVGGNTRGGSTSFSRITKLLEISDFRAAISGAVALPKSFRRTVLGPFARPAPFVIQRRPGSVVRCGRPALR
jgi:hypothetical protein